MFPGIEIGQQRPSRRAATANAAPTSIILLPQKPSHLSSDLFITKDRCRHPFPFATSTPNIGLFQNLDHASHVFASRSLPVLSFPSPKVQGCPSSMNPPTSSMPSLTSPLRASTMYRELLPSRLLLFAPHATPLLHLIPVTLLDPCQHATRIPSSSITRPSCPILPSLCLITLRRWPEALSVRLMPRGNANCASEIRRGGTR